VSLSSTSISCCLRPDLESLIEIYFTAIWKLCTINIVVRASIVFILPLAFVSSGFLSSCGSSKNPAPAAKQVKGQGSSQHSIAVAASREADDFGRFLAGLPGKSGSAYAKFEEDPAWIAHREAFASDWAKFDKSRVPVLQEFQKKELKGAPNASGTLFYPFGGPDFVTANLFFPANDNYVFVGLEPAGTVRSAEAFEKQPLASSLPRMRSTLGSLLRRSFFITAEMERQVRGQITDGLLPLLLVQMTRTGHTILGHRYVTLDAQGNYVDRKPGDATPRNRGVVLEFQRDGSSEVKHLTYISVNLSNESFKRNAEFRAFMEQLKPMSTFFKSASYLPHSENFSLIRQQVLAKSDAIAQDDTGVPFRFFDSNKWNVMLYGKYTQPYGTFRYRKQSDLKVAFDKGENVKNLGFFIGYGYGHAPSNLLVARRRAS
jgi:hypothetical protein